MTWQNAHRAEISESVRTQQWNTQFTWNEHLIQLLKPLEDTDILLRFIRGFVTINKSTVSGVDVLHLLVSRLSTYRVGYRLQRRGCDISGHCANTVETESSIICNSPLKSTSSSNTSSIQQIHLCSYVQARGSAPLPFLQIPDTRYKPPIFFPADRTVSINASQKAVNILHAQYENVTFINLLDDRKHEKELCAAYTDIMTELMKKPENKDWLHYQYFDFHHICRKMHFERVSLLLPLIDNDRTKFGFFHLSTEPNTSEPTVHLEQHGVFRVNCLDSLDRTGIAQHLLALVTLQSQLAACGVIAPSTVSYASSSSATGDDTPAPPFPSTTSSEFDGLLKILWSDNANAMSNLNTGTNAMKSDYTRTGKRTMLGAITDGIIGVRRYFLNQFVQPFEQDSLDFFLGKHTSEVGFPGFTESTQNRFIKPSITKPLTSLTPLQFFFAFNIAFILAIALASKKVLPRLAKKWPDSSVAAIIDSVSFLLVFLALSFALFKFLLLPIMKAHSHKIVAHSQLLGDEYDALAEHAGGRINFHKSITDKKEDEKKSE